MEAVKVTVRGCEGTPAVPFTTPIALIVRGPAEGLSMVTFTSAVIADWFSVTVEASRRVFGSVNTQPAQESWTAPMKTGLPATVTKNVAGNPDGNVTLAGAVNEKSETISVAFAVAVCEFGDDAVMLNA